MDTKKNDTRKQIHFGEFKDKTLEKEFLNAEITKNLNYVKFIILIAAIVYFLFIVPEYFLIKNTNDFIDVFINRSVVLVLLIFLYFKVKYERKHEVLIYWFSVYEIVITFSFFYISNKLPSPNVLVQAFGLMVIILLVFMIHNKWLYSIIISLIISISFFVFVAICFSNVNISEYLAASSHIIIVVFLSSVSSYSINYYKRIQYLNNIELVKRSEKDALTGIYNKAKFNKEYARLADRVSEKDTCFSVVMFDIDDFKNINDQYGHLVGDEVLQELTNLIRNNIKQGDVFVRWGGEEFVLIFPDTQLEEAIIMTERVRKLLENHSFEKVGQVTCSFGVVVFKKDDDLNKVLQEADQHLYMAKNAGKNMVM